RVPTLPARRLSPPPTRSDRLALGLLSQAQSHGTGHPDRPCPTHRPAGSGLDRGGRSPDARTDPRLRESDPRRQRLERDRAPPRAGRVWGGRDPRLDPLRDWGAAGLRGKVWACYNPASGLILDLVLEENGHAQERSLLDQIPVEPGQLWIADRNCCVRTFLF